MDKELRGRKSESLAKFIGEAESERIFIGDTEK
jgi:hypothetical protein